MRALVGLKNSIKGTTIRSLVAGALELQAEKDLEISIAERHLQRELRGRCFKTSFFERGIKL